MSSGTRVFQLKGPRKRCKLQGTVDDCLRRTEKVRYRPSRVVVKTKDSCLLVLLAAIVKGYRGITLRGPACKRTCHLFRQLDCRIYAISVSRDKVQVSRLRGSKTSVTFIVPSRRCPLKYIVPVREEVRLLG